jgi:hypothetical protein
MDMVYYSAEGTADILVYIDFGSNPVKSVNEQFWPVR